MSDGRAQLAEAGAALGRGQFLAARAAYEAALQAGESAEAHDRLATLSLILDDVDAARRHGEAAYRQHRAAGDPCRAATAAIAVASALTWLGNEAAISGWLGRAARLLEEAGECVELGYLAVARIGCDVTDVVALEASADAALEVARRFGDADLEARALADGGLALVSQGRIDEGLARLDEAMASVVAGEVRNHVMAGGTCCAMLHACDRLGDLERAAQWTDSVFTSARERFGEPPPVVLESHCRLVYGTVLGELGRWDEAEAQMRRTLEGTSCLHYRADASARLADLRIRQGRLAEAAELLAGYGDRREAAEAMARLHAARGELDLAAATLRRALRELRTDRLSCAPLLRLSVEIEIERADIDAARRAASELREIAESTRAPAVVVLSELSQGRVAAAGGGDAAAHLHRALDVLTEGQRPLLRAEIQLELAEALRAGDPAAAAAEARAALAVFERLGARQASARAAALLRGLGVRVGAPRASAADAQALTRREREVLALLGEGLSNADIGRRLFISAKTAEHHVGAVLGKLGLRTRAEAAAWEASQRERVGP